MSRAKRWVFTLNNPTDDEQQKLADGCEQTEYAVYGRETGESGTPHLQGFVIFPSAIRRTTVKNRLGCPRFHLEVARGTDDQAADYCKKDGDFEEYGTLPETRQGRRTDLEGFFTWADAQGLENGHPVTTPQVARAHPTILTKYPRVMPIVRLRFDAEPLQSGQPNDWQQHLIEKLDGPADPRQIHFYVDQDGGKGKSWFVRYYLTLHSGTTQFMSIGKRDDIAHVVKEQTRVFLFDIPRTAMEFLQYTTLEQMKNRLVFSPKYNSITKTLHCTPHVVVFCNEHPDYEKMTDDRYDITQLSP
jgi:hypothetical protein